MKTKTWVFDDYIYECFCNFLKQPGHTAKHKQGIRLAKGVKFKMTDIPNNCPELVDDHIWHEILEAHLKLKNYN